jgi:hypothetical protein
MMAERFMSKNYIDEGTAPSNRFHSNGAGAERAADIECWVQGCSMMQKFMIGKPKLLQEITFGITMILNYHAWYLVDNSDKPYEEETREAS